MRRTRAFALAVLLGVMTARLDVMVLGVGGMAVGDMCVMCRLLVIASLVMFRGFAMVLRSLLMVLRRLVVVLTALMRAHFSLPAQENLRNT